MDVTDYQIALEFRELSDFSNVPVTHGNYEADKKVAVLPNILGPGSWEISYC